MQNRPSHNGPSPVSSTAVPLLTRIRLTHSSIVDFSKTLFTPAGLDIYMRQPLAATGDAGKAQLEDIVTAITASTNETVALMAKHGGFVVGHP